MVGASFVARYWSSDWPLPQPEVVLPKLLNCVPALSGRAVSMPPVPRACSEPSVAAERAVLQRRVQA